MTAERWGTIRTLFHSAMERPPAERRAYIGSVAECDPELMEELLAMVRQSERETGRDLLDVSLLGRQLVRPAMLARTLNPGLVLAGRYRIVRPVGAGGMGEVYEAEDLELGARVAVKTMRVEGEDALARFKREIHLARTVTHPNVCRIFDLHRHHDGETGGVLTFLTMEFVEGETLSLFLARHGRLTARQALPIAEQIALALSAAHSKDVIHRDLKPANIILTESGNRAVVTDFGLACVPAQSTESTVTIVGTPAYMSPEQFEGRSITAAVDIYAFGVLLYEMVVGNRPFSGGSPIALAIKKIQTAPPRAGDLVPSLPVAWTEVIRKCLEPIPERRFGNVRDALHRLQETVEKRPLIRLGRDRKRALAAALLLVAAIGAGSWGYRSSVHSPSGEAKRLYKQGVHAYQLGLPWKASQLFGAALEQDKAFTAAGSFLAEAWMDLDQPARAKAELENVEKLKPRWRRAPLYALLLADAARARFRTDFPESLRLHRLATAVAPSEELPDMIFGEATAMSRGGNRAGAVERYSAAERGSPYPCDAILARMTVLWADDIFTARVLNDAAIRCFEEAGDLDGLAQTEFIRYGLLKRGSETAGPRVRLEHAISLADNSGNTEQQILIGAAMSEMLLETGDEDGAYASFTRAMQTANRQGLKFFAVRMLDDRAQYLSEKEQFFLSDQFNSQALIQGTSAGTVWSTVRCTLRGVSLMLRMGLTHKAEPKLEAAESLLKQFPNRELTAELKRLTELSRHTESRPERN